MIAIYKRELKAYFLTPIGYIFCGMYLAVSGLAFADTTLLEQSTSSLPTYFLYMMAIFAILIPLLTMKLFAEDRKSRTEQVLLTAPVSLTGMIMGKYFAALTVFAATFLVNSFNFVLLFQYGSPNTASIFSNILGLFLIGCAFIAIGAFLSALTENQLIAAVTSIGSIAAILVVSFVADKIGVQWVRVVLKWFSIINRYAPFTNQQLDITAIVYFFSLSAVFLFLTVRVYEKRRWS
ncbi:MAG: ABC transporter [Firmicutes bacterium HGW-Firmicutes-21]|nr:MAG: ABC transporter [Firmicutes bacterium HGW-Firmicutes-21]